VSEMDPDQGRTEGEGEGISEWQVRPDQEPTEPDTTEDEGDEDEDEDDDGQDDDNNDDE
jgi:hypothetical protein